MLFKWKSNVLLSLFASLIKVWEEHCRNVPRYWEFISFRGRVIAAEVCSPALGLKGQETEAVRWHVHHHLPAAAARERKPLLYADLSPPNNYDTILSPGEAGSLSDVSNLQVGYSTERKCRSYCLIQEKDRYSDKCQNSNINGVNGFHVVGFQSKLK